MIERVDYYSDEEYQNALDWEEAGRQQAESFEEYMRHLEEEGYISNDGQPLRCTECGEMEFERLDEHFESVGCVEYALKCKSCGHTVGRWAYGGWQA